MKGSNLLKAVCSALCSGETQSPVLNLFFLALNKYLLSLYHGSFTMTIFENLAKDSSSMIWVYAVFLHTFYCRNHQEAAVLGTYRGEDQEDLGSHMSHGRLHGRSILQEGRKGHVVRFYTEQSWREDGGAVMNIWRCWKEKGDSGKGFSSCGIIGQNLWVECFF